MNLARKGHNESDVHVFGCAGIGFRCHECLLKFEAPAGLDNVCGPMHSEETANGMLRHLVQHLERGHIVPVAALNHLHNQTRN